MNLEREEALLFLKQYAELEPVVILDHPPQAKAEPVDTDKQPLLDQIATKVASCTKCVLHAGRSNTVFGTGDPNCSLMFVGEGPGADEDRQGEPFVGKAGQLLNRIIAAMKLEREQVYIANIVKCRPPDNRNPLPNEAAACLPYLHQQINIIKPQVIVCLGLVAAIYLLKKPPMTTIKSLRGSMYDFAGIPVIVTYHPAALLRSPALKAPTWEDMQLVMQLLSGEIPYPKH